MLLQAFGQLLIECVCESLLVLVAEGFGAAGFHARPPEVVHKISDGEAFSDVGFGKQRAMDTDDYDPFGNQNCRQRDVLGNDDIAGGGVRCDILIGDIRALRYRDQADIVAYRYINGLVRHKNGFNAAFNGRF